MFGMFTRNSGGGGQQPAQPQPQQQPDQQQQQQQQPAPPAPQPAPQQQQTISLSSLLGQDRPADPMEFATKFMDAISAAPQVDPTQGQQIQINPTALSEALKGIDMTTGADLQKLFESQNDPTAFGTELKTLLQQTSQNTIATMVPLINQLVSQAVAQAQAQAVQMSQQAVTVDNLITTFQNTHSYGNNPILSRMLPGMAQALVQSAPAGTSVQTLVDALHTTMTGMSVATGGNPNGGSQSRAVGQTDFSGLFSQ